VKRTPLGDTGLSVSEVCLGTMTFGQQNSLAEAHEQLDLAFERGVNFIDAAEMYPVPTEAETYGRTETIVGDWLAKRPRDRVVIATKIAGAGRNLAWVRGGPKAVDRRNIEEALEGSLRRLATDHVDLYQIHWPDRYVPAFGASFFDPAQDRTFTPILEQLSVFADLIKAGKIRALGLSNETPWGLAAFGHAARQAGLPGVVTVQNAYNLINRAFDFYPAEAAHREHVGLLAYSPLAFGLLSGKYARGATPPGARLTDFPQFGLRYRKPAVNAAVDAYVDLARSRGLAPAVLALAFVRSRWFVTSTIIGATHRSQLEENLSSLEVTLDADTLNAIDDIHLRSPSPAL
jgi:aryl-alcohol dehydrogenase-like predicted oxidoreductase